MQEEWRKEAFIQLLVIVAELILMDSVLSIERIWKLWIALWFFIRGDYSTIFMTA